MPNISREERERRGLTIPIHFKDYSLYFKGEEEALIFFLTEMDGEARARALGITRQHYSINSLAKRWRDIIAKKIHPDICNHPHAADAMIKLTEFYESMVGK
jgi:hypothetical protein